MSIAQSLAKILFKMGGQDTSVNGGENAILSEIAEQYDGGGSASECYAAPILYGHNDFDPSVGKSYIYVTANKNDDETKALSYSDLYDILTQKQTAVIATTGQDVIYYRIFDYTPNSMRIGTTSYSGEVKTYVAESGAGAAKFYYVFIPVKRDSFIVHLSYDYVSRSYTSEETFIDLFNAVAEDDKVVMFVLADHTDGADSYRILPFQNVSINKNSNIYSADFYIVDQTGYTLYATHGESDDTMGFTMFNG